jgi:hypothetical protein
MPNRSACFRSKGGRDAVLRVTDLEAQFRKLSITGIKARRGEMETQNRTMRSHLVRS